MDHGKGDRGILQPAELCTKTGERGMEVLHTKHPETCPPTAANVDFYLDCPPELVSVDITGDTMAAVAGKLSGGAGTCGTASVILQHWLLHFVEASGELRLIVAEFMEWMRSLSRRNLATIDGQVPISGDGSGGQGFLWD